MYNIIQITKGASMNKQKTKGAMQKLGVLLVLFLFFFYGCENPTELQDSSLSVTVFSEGSLQKDQSSTLQLNSVKVLIRKLEFKSANSNDLHDIKVGPFVININPDGIKTDVMRSDILPGSYERVKFEVHKLEDFETPPDQDFIDGNSGSERFSAVVNGTFNNTPFDYKSQRTTYQELEFPTPIVIDDNMSVNLTIIVNPYSWFFEDGVYLDPSDPSNESKIEMNIEHSFKDAFKDNNKDGKPD
jgi:hypothetical protein